MKLLFLTSYFSVFVWTDALLPLLKKTAAEPDSDVRIVNVRALNIRPSRQEKKQLTEQ